MHRVRFALPDTSPVRLAIYNLKGKEVRLLLTGHLPAGEHQALWDGNDNHGHAANQGIYFYRLDCPSFHRVRKFVRA